MWERKKNSSCVAVSPVRLLEEKDWGRHGLNTKYLPKMYGE